MPDKIRAHAAPARSAIRDLRSVHLVLSGRVGAQHRLDLEEVAQSVLAPFTAIARHLEAAKGRVHVALRAIDRDLAGPQPPPDARRTHAIARPDVCRQA